MVVMLMCVARDGNWLKVFKVWSNMCTKARRVSQAVFLSVNSWLETWWWSRELWSAFIPAAFGLGTRLYGWEGNWSTWFISSKGVQYDRIMPLLDSAFQITVMVSLSQWAISQMLCSGIGSRQIKLVGLEWIQSGEKHESMSVSLSTERWCGVHRCL